MRLIYSRVGILDVGLRMLPVTLTTEQPGRGTHSSEPIVGFRSWRIYRDGTAAGRLSSPYYPALWTEPTLRAECRRFECAESLLQERHAAPDPHCGCGICAYHAPTADLSLVDFRAVSGIVTVWGDVLVDGDGMRAEMARVEALGLYSRWTRRQREAVAEVADDLGLDLVDLRDLGPAAVDYGAAPVTLVPDESLTGEQP